MTEQCICQHRQMLCFLFVGLICLFHQRYDLAYGFCQLARMDLSGKMDRTFPVDRVPPGRICRTVKLCFKPYFPYRVVHRMTYQPRRSFPRCPARSPADDTNVSYYPAVSLHHKLGSAKIFTIPAKADLPWKSASGRRSNYPPAHCFLARGDHRDVFPGTQRRKIGRQITVF